MAVVFKHLKELNERLAVFDLYHQLNPRLDEHSFAERMKLMANEKNYYLLAMYDEDNLIAISGYWIAHKLYCGKYLEPDNVVVHEKYRSQGVGQQLQQELEAIAKENGCNVMMLDAYLANEAGHKFYEKHGYKKTGYHFIKKLHEKTS